MADDVNGWDYVNSKPAETTGKPLVGKPDTAFVPDEKVVAARSAIPGVTILPNPPKADDATLHAELARLTAPVIEPIVIAGFTRIANDDDFKAWLKEVGPFGEGCSRVPNNFPFWVRPAEAYVRFAGYRPDLIVLSKDDVQSLMNCTNQAISLYGHWQVERRAWALDESAEG